MRRNRLNKLCTFFGTVGIISKCAQCIGNENKMGAGKLENQQSPPAHEKVQSHANRELLKELGEKHKRIKQASDQKEELNEGQVELREKRGPKASADRRQAILLSFLSNNDKDAKTKDSKEPSFNPAESADAPENSKPEAITQPANTSSKSSNKNAEKKVKKPAAAESADAPENETPGFVAQIKNLFFKNSSKEKDAKKEEAEKPAVAESADAPENKPGRRPPMPLPKPSSLHKDAPPAWPERQDGRAEIEEDPLYDTVNPEMPENPEDRFVHAQKNLSFKNEDGSSGQYEVIESNPIYDTEISSGYATIDHVKSSKTSPMQESGPAAISEACQKTSSKSPDHTTINGCIYAVPDTCRNKKAHFQPPQKQKSASNKGLPDDPIYAKHADIEILASKTPRKAASAREYEKTIYAEIQHSPSQKTEPSTKKNAPAPAPENSNPWIHSKPKNRNFIQ
ncbi:uncharacterized protein NEMAJ01_0110 [Nematocida major]|uniref:uncharacterized protein n=1 Tax=Nematocida major TaxID=1912982 RepID=UPI00200763C8|nr:uncharacterized protein NEMAJ01_0110 [Nematocida major]KAH9385214.1 hypothetical protein NEMAJ01_0110 [Nematocida major]